MDVQKIGYLYRTDQCSGSLIDPISYRPRQLTTFKRSANGCFSMILHYKL